MVRSHGSVPVATIVSGRVLGSGPAYAKYEGLPAHDTVDSHKVEAATLSVPEAVV